ncbi:MAG: TonB-dependent receptor [Myxococcota bacterium]
MISIFGDAGNRAPGSAFSFSEEHLRRLSYDDVGRLLKQVPGVYIRDEDGYGLRPNIGLRGASSDRSKKVVLMEDGVLIGPAPYSAPAAYYFPLLARATGLEVYKGPASIRYGPNTVGGAVNVLSRSVPKRRSARIDLAGGQRLLGRARGVASESFNFGAGRLGILLEGAHLRSAGFRDVDDDGDAGFRKSEFVGKVRWSSTPEAVRAQSIELKMVYSNELSRESYLGLSEDDFAQDPRRRYFVTRQAEMDNWRTSVQLRHELELSDFAEITTTVYRHDFERTWGRLSSIGDASFTDVLYGDRQDLLPVLRGERDTGPAETLIFATNDRLYYSGGLQSALTYRPVLGHELEIGVRLHQDIIRRFHTRDDLIVVDGALTEAGTDTVLRTHNRDRSRALAAHFVDTIQWRGLTLTPGTRIEAIQWRRRDRVSGESRSDSYAVVLPGVGAYLELAEDLGALAGVHRGFSPTAPGSEDATPESSVNYEAGLRYDNGTTRGEVLGFFNDYQNLTNICSFAGGCTDDVLDAQTGAGQVHVWGAEASFADQWALGGGVRATGRVSYTFTASRFREAFSSADDLFGEVDPGETLPYIPTHQAGLELDLSAGHFALNTSASYVGAMREVADEQDPVFGTLRTDAQLLVDAGASVATGDDGEVYLRAENLLNQQAVVARRPFGARAGRPFTLFAGVRFAL